MLKYSEFIFPDYKSTEYSLIIQGINPKNKKTYFPCQFLKWNEIVTLKLVIKNVKQCIKSTRRKSFETTEFKEWQSCAMNLVMTEILTATLPQFWIWVNSRNFIWPESSKFKVKLWILDYQFPTTVYRNSTLRLVNSECAKKNLPITIVASIIFD